MYAPIGSPQNQVLIMNSIFTSHVVSIGIGKKKPKTTKKPTPNGLWPVRIQNFFLRRSELKTNLQGREPFYQQYHYFLLWVCMALAPGTFICYKAFTLLVAAGQCRGKLILKIGKVKEHNLLLFYRWRNLTKGDVKVLVKVLDHVHTASNGTQIS